MEKIQYFCDICKIECKIDGGLGTLSGFLMKMTSDLQSQKLIFGEHYCHLCTELVLKFIEEMKNATNTNTPGVVKQTE